MNIWLSIYLGINNNVNAIKTTGDSNMNERYVEEDGGFVVKELAGNGYMFYTDEFLPKGVARLNVTLNTGEGVEHVTIIDVIAS